MGTPQSSHPVPAPIASRVGSHDSQAGTSPPFSNRSSISPTNTSSSPILDRAVSASGLSAPTVTSTPVVGRATERRLSVSAAPTLARYAHPPAVPSRLSEQHGQAASTSSARRKARNRLSFYTDEDRLPVSAADSDSDDDDSKQGSDDELLFAMSDMNCI